MLSNERQQKKPYAMPDRFTLYTRYMCVISQQRLQKKWQRDEGLDVCSCTCRAREALWELSVFPKNTKQCPQPGFEPGPLHPETSALTMMPPQLPTGTCLNVLVLWKVNFKQNSSTSVWDISISCTIQEYNVTNPFHPIFTSKRLLMRGK